MAALFLNSAAQGRDPPEVLASGLCRGDLGSGGLGLEQDPSLTWRSRERRRGARGLGSSSGSPRSYCHGWTRPLAALDLDFPSAS